MTYKRKVVVKINGQDFTVVGSETEEYIKSIADYVDDNIKDITKKNSKLSQSMAAVLAAFNIADQFYKNHMELNDLRENVVEPLKELEVIKVELRDCKGKFEVLKGECDNYKDELIHSKREGEKSNKKIKQYEQALKFKEEEIQKSQKIINELQNKLFENQLELVQIKKELEESLKTMDKIGNSMF